MRAAKRRSVFFEKHHVFPSLNTSSGKKWNASFQKGEKKRILCQKKKVAQFCGTVRHLRPHIGGLVIDSKRKPD